MANTVALWVEELREAVHRNTGPGLPLRDALIGQRSDAAFYSAWESNKRVLIELLNALDAAYPIASAGAPAEAPTADEPVAWTVAGPRGFLETWDHPDNYGVTPEENAKKRAAWCNKHWTGVFAATPLFARAVPPADAPREETTDTPPAAPLPSAPVPEGDEVIVVGHKGEEPAIRAITEMLNTPKGRGDFRPIPGFAMPPADVLEQIRAYNAGAPAPEADEIAEALASIRVENGWAHEVLSGEILSLRSPSCTTSRTGSTTTSIRTALAWGA